MNLGFVALGSGVLIDASRRIKEVPLGAVAFVVFGISMILNGIFSHRPIDPVLPYDVLEDQLHSLFSSGVGAAFAFGTLCFAFYCDQRPAKVLCLSATAAAVILPLSMLAFAEVAGLLQRLMFAISFAWLIYFLPRRNGRRNRG